MVQVSENDRPDKLLWIPPMNMIVMTMLKKRNSHNALTPCSDSVKSMAMKNAVFTPTDAD